MNMMTISCDVTEYALFAQIEEQQMEFLLNFGDEPTIVYMNRETWKALHPGFVSTVSGLEVRLDCNLPYGVTAVADDLGDDV